MPMQVGTHDVQFLLAQRFQSAAAFGLNTIAEILQADLDAHNRIVNEMMTEMADVSADRQRIYGSTTDTDMVKVDEYGRSVTQRTAPGATVGFPLELYQYGVGWTEKFFQVATPADLAIAQQNAQKAHLRAIRREIKRAIYLSGNRAFVDFLMAPQITLNVKAFLNADGTPIPSAPDTETAFDPTVHTHYTAVNGLTANAAQALVNNVVEHGHGNEVRVYINLADEQTWRGLTGFQPFVDIRIAQPALTANVPIGRTDYGQMYNRAIGLFGAATVWIKPWALPNYAFCTDIGSPAKPLLFRQRDAQALQGLRIAATLNAYPLVAQFQEAEFGLGVWNRTNGAVLYYGGGSYTDPTL